MWSTSCAALNCLCTQHIVHSKQTQPRPTKPGHVAPSAEIAHCLQPRNIIVAGWCGDVEHLVRGITAFAPDGSVVTLICECNPEVSNKLSSDARHIEHQSQAGQALVRRVLACAPLLLSRC